MKKDNKKGFLSKRVKVITVAIAVVVTCGLTVFTVSQIRAEISGGSNESNSTSRIKTLYNELNALSYGTDTDNPSWGTIWNRIKTAAKWVPSGNATASDVRSGKTFNGSSRTPTTGTYPAPGPCITQAYHDSYGAAATQTTNCTDVISWTTPTDSIAGTEKQDSRTGLIWSQYLKNTTGTVGFAASGGSDWSWDGTTDVDSIAVGNKTAKLLCSERGNGWRLPTQKELMQVYIDGSFWNLTNPSNNFWSATENSATGAWAVALNTGYTSGPTKTTSYYVRCVR